MGTTEVSILGQRYTIKGDAPEEYIKELAAFVDRKLKDVYGGAPNITPVKASILAALDITDELFQLRRQHESLTRNIEEKTEMLSTLFD
jgi:cell division protein ZapA